MQKRTSIKSFYNSTVRPCKTAFILNVLLSLSALLLSILYLTLTARQNALFVHDSDRWIAWGLGLSFLAFSALMLLALLAMASGNKLVKLFFMLITILALPFAIGFALKGLLMVVLLTATLIANIMCYNRLHPRKEHE